VKKVILLIFTAEILLTLYGIYRTLSFGDEEGYHSPLAKNITWQMIFDRNSSYSSAYTPLPYLIGHAVYRIIPSLYA